MSIIPLWVFGDERREGGRERYILVACLLASLDKFPGSRRDPVSENNMESNQERHLISGMCVFRHIYTHVYMCSYLLMHKYIYNTHIHHL